MSENDKNACEYSVEIAKQFLTLGSAGIAFLVALASAQKTPVNSIFYITFGLFAASIGVGLFYIMNVVGHIQKDGNYNVYTPRLRILGAIQVLSFLSSVILLAFIAAADLSAPKKVSLSNNANLEVKIKDKEIRHTVAPGDTVKLTVSEQGSIDFQVISAQPLKP